MTARVVHCQRERFNVYVGRVMPGLHWTKTSIWGNPFLAATYGRTDAIRRYEEWLLQQPQLLAQLPSLRGKILGCWCAPLACHADVLLRLANPPEPGDATRLMRALLEPPIG